MKNILIAMVIIGVAAVTRKLAVSVDTSQTLDTANRAQVDTAEIKINNSVNDTKTGGHIGENGIQEVPLTGENEQKARDAALKAVPGGTVERLETDAEGSPFEAHMRKSDGSRVTVKFDNNFGVTKIEEGLR